MSRPLTVVQLVPELGTGGVERGTVEIAQALTAAGHRALVVSGGGPLAAEVEACGAEHVTLPVGAKRLASLRLVPVLAALFQDRGADVVHARSRLPAWLARFALARLDAQARPAWVTTVHGPYTVNRYSRVMVSGETVIAISEFIRDYVLESYRGVDPARVTVIPRGVDRGVHAFGFAPDAAWRERWAREQAALAGRRLLTLPGRLTRWKGQLDFIAMVAALRQRGLDVHGLVVGAAHRRKPRYAEELARAARDAGVADRVSFLGNRTDLREILAISDLACSLTREPEAFGRTTIEALSLGTPVLGYDHGGTGEILARVYPQGRVPPGDVAAAAARAAALLAEPPPVPREHPYTVASMQAATLGVYAERVRVSDAARTAS